MSAHGDENTGETETGIIEGSEENGMRFSPNSVDERKSVSLASPCANHYPYRNDGPLDSE